jgi:hypothetical protein
LSIINYRKIFKINCGKNRKIKDYQKQPQPTKQIPSSRPKVRKIDLKDEDTLVDTPQQPSQEQPPPQQQQQPSSSSSRQQQQQSLPEQLAQQQPPQQQSAVQSIVHSVPDDANLNDTLLRHCDLLANQMPSIAAAAASTQDITLQLHLPTEAADLNIQSLEAICKLVSL